MKLIIFSTHHYSHRCTKQQISGQTTIEDTRCIMRKEKGCSVKDQLMVNNHGIIIHKAGHKKGHRHDDFAASKKNHHVASKEVVNYLALNIHGLRKTFQNKTFPYCIKRINQEFFQRERGYNKNILKRE
jgi:hypothetical protein